MVRALRGCILQLPSSLTYPQELQATEMNKGITVNEVLSIIRHSRESMTVVRPAAKRVDLSKRIGRCF